MTEMKAIHILNRGNWQNYIQKDEMSMDDWLQFQEALNTALESLAVQAAIKTLAVQIKNG